METMTKTIIKSDNKWDGNLSDFKKHEDKIVLDAPVFIMFAEYLGYVSRFNKLAEDMCDGKIPDVYIQKVLNLEANIIFKQMKKDYSMDEIKYWYSIYYPIILKDYIDKLNSLLLI